MKNTQSCLIIAGEKSGEDHAMTFLPKLKELNPECEFYGVGGSRLENLGVELKYHLKEFSGIGISEVLGKIPFYYRALDHLLDEVKKRDTKTAILIDFQGFNLKLAKKLKKMNVNVLYYVAPQAWVWKPWRAKVLEKNVHTLFTILPFEKEWFQKRGVSKVKAVIHPLMIEYGNEIEKVDSDSKGTHQKWRILLLPGSRNVEVGKLLHVFERALNILREEKFEFEVGIVKTESVNQDLYNLDYSILKTWSSEELKEALNWADLSIAASGTVTLATGLFQVPTVVCYKVSFFTEAVLSLLVPYDGPISLTNIVHNQFVFPELVQEKADRYNIAKYMRTWMKDKEEYRNTVNVLKATAKQLTGDNFSVPDYMSNVIKGEQN